MLYCTHASGCESSSEESCSPTCLCATTLSRVTGTEQGVVRGTRGTCHFRNWISRVYVASSAAAKHFRLCGSHLNSRLDGFDCLTQIPALPGIYVQSPKCGPRRPREQGGARATSRLDGGRHR